MQARPGDTLLVKERRAGQGDREAVIIEVWGELGKPPYVVRWHDGRQNVFFPASADTLIPQSPPLALPAASPARSDATSREGRGPRTWSGRAALGRAGPGQREPDARLGRTRWRLDGGDELGRLPRPHGPGRCGDLVRGDVVAGRLLAAGVLLGVAAAFLIVVPVRLSSREPGRRLR